MTIVRPSVHPVLEATQSHLGFHFFAPSLAS